MLSIILLPFFIGCLVNGAPSEGIVEIEKQRLIKFPENPYQVPNMDRLDETKRILNEINKININFGYVKKPPSEIESGIQSKMPIVLNSEQYFFPRPSYHPLNSNYNHNSLPFPASIRNLKQSQFNQIGRKFHPRDFQSPMLLPKYLTIPIYQAPRYFQGNGNYEIIEDLPNESNSRNNDVTNNKSIVNNVYKINFSDNFNDFVNNVYKNKNELRSLNDLPIVFLPAKVTTLNEIQREYRERQHIKQLSEKQRQNNKKKDVSSNKNHSELNQSNKYVNNKLTQASQITNIPLKLNADTEKGSFGFFNKPITTQKPFILTTTTATTTIKPSITDILNQLVEKHQNESDDYEDLNEKIEIDESAAEKGLFSKIKPDHEKTQQEAIKDGGIIIQRLKVRKGGIAIAGPGGIATAGSGGTAIVGPGGLALTHPRSLTIAGPGAKVISFPESYDLGEAALRTKSKNSIGHDLIPEGGKLVATGPIVYFNRP